MTTQSRRAAVVEAVVVEEPRTPRPEVVEASPLTDESTVEWRRQLAGELLQRAKTDGVRLVGPDGLLASITKAVLETALQTELSEHLGYDRGDPAGRGWPNSRNAGTPKTVHTDLGPVRIEVPRDRVGSFQPRIVPKNARRIGGFDEAIISLYAKGLTTGEIQAHLDDVYGAEICRELVSRVTDAVNDELVAWRNRPLDRLYPVCFIDAITVKIRDGAVANRPVYVAVGGSVDGERDVLGMWVGTGGEGAKQWLAYLSELKTVAYKTFSSSAATG